MAKKVNKQVVSQQPQKNKKKKIAQSGKGSGGREMAVRIGPGTLGYLGSVLDPSTSAASGVPTYPSILSQKTRLWAKGSFVTGEGASGGLGYVMCKPWPVSDGAQGGILFTNATKDDQTITSTVSTEVTAANPNAPYATARIAAEDVQWRCVGCMLRAQCTTAPLSRQGSVFALREPENGDIGTATIDTVAKILKYEESIKLPTNRLSQTDWISVTWLPRKDVENDFHNTSVSAVTGYCMIIGCVTGVTTPQAFDWEYWEIMEYIGPDVPAKTPTIHDEIGFSAVESALTRNLTIIRPSTSSRAAILRQGLSATANVLGQMSCPCPG